METGSNPVFSRMLKVFTFLFATDSELYFLKSLKVKASSLNYLANSNFLNTLNTQRGSYILLSVGENIISKMGVNFFEVGGSSKFKFI